MFPSANANLIDIKIYWSSLGARQRHRDRRRWSRNMNLWRLICWSGLSKPSSSSTTASLQTLWLESAAASGLQHLPDSRETAQVSVCHKHTTHSNTPEINWITLHLLLHRFTEKGTWKCFCSLSRARWGPITERVHAREGKLISDINKVTITSFFSTVEFNLGAARDVFCVEKDSLLSTYNKCASFDAYCKGKTMIQPQYV